MQYVETPTKAFTAGAAIGKYLLVKLSSGVLAKAGLGDEFLGVLEDASFASGDVRSVRLRSAQGTIPCEAAGAISAAAIVYGAANGQISTTSTGAIRVGMALEAATAAGDHIEVLPC